MSIPVNIVAGDYDPAVSRVALDRGSKSRPDGALDIIRDPRHFSPEESPERVVCVITRRLVPS
jgi:hypothetical protein